MKYAVIIAAGSALACLAGCASPSQVAISERVGPAPTASRPAALGSALQVYSARMRLPVDLNREEFVSNNDFGKNDFPYEPGHTDYTICSQDGKALQEVRNARDPSDPEPAMVPLAPGTYRIEALARGFGTVSVPVVIEPGKLTSVNLQSCRKPISDSVPRMDMVLLGNSRVVGWKATAITPAENQ
jgi:hypothetical protein